MPALVTGNSNGMCIFLNGAFHNFMYAAVVAKMNNLRRLCFAKYGA